MEHTLSHLGIEEMLRSNIKVAYFEAGHMMYVHAASIARLGTDLRTFIEEST